MNPWAIFLLLGAERFCPCLGQFTRRRIGRWLEPTSQIANGQIRQRRDPDRTLVEAGDVVKFPATGLEERGLSFLRDFLERLQTVADKARANDVDTPDAG